MILKIYLGIGILTFICITLTNLSAIRCVKNKYGKKLDAIETKTDIAGTILTWLKLIIVSFIPIYNVIMLFCLVFMGDKITTRSNEIVEEALKNAEKENN